MFCKFGILTCYMWCSYIAYAPDKPPDNVCENGWTVVTTHQEWTEENWGQAPYYIVSWQVCYAMLI